MSNKMHTCPECRNEFLQPLVCITCGAERLYDATVLTQAEQIARLTAERDEWRDADRAECAENARLRARLAECEQNRREMRSTLAELRLRLHAAGRRPEECYEMSMIDAVLHEHAP